MDPKTHADGMREEGDDEEDNQDHSKLEDAEAEYHQTTVELITAVIAEEAKVPGYHGIALTSNILSLVSRLPINPILMSGINLPPERDYKILIPEPSQPQHLSGGGGTNITNTAVPRSGYAQCAIRQPAIKFVHPITQVHPMFPLSISKATSEAPPPPGGWKYSPPKFTSTPTPALGSGNQKMTWASRT